MIDAEKAELQVSLLNEIGLTLTAVAERLKPIERIDTIEGMILDLAQRLYGRLEGIETTLIKEFINAKQSRDSDYALDDRRWEVMHDRVQAIESQLVALAKEQVAQAETLKTYKLSLEGIQGLLVDLTHSFDVIAEVQANSYDAVVTKFMHIEKRLAQIEERLRTELEGMRNIVDALGERLEPCKVCAGKRRVHALFERKTLENKAATVDEIMAAHDGRKPRKAGKRPAHKAGKRLKTSKL